MVRSWILTGFHTDTRCLPVYPSVHILFLLVEIFIFHHAMFDTAHWVEMNLNCVHNT